MYLVIIDFPVAIETTMMAATVIITAIAGRIARHDRIQGLDTERRLNETVDQYRYSYYPPARYLFQTGHNLIVGEQTEKTTRLPRLPMRGDQNGAPQV